MASLPLLYFVYFSANGSQIIYVLFPASSYRTDHPLFVKYQTLLVVYILKKMFL